MASAAQKCSCIVVLAICGAFLVVPKLRAQQAMAPANPTTSSASAPEIPKAVSDKLADLDKRVTAAQSAGDNA